MPSYMNNLHGRHRPAMQHRRWQSIWPSYTLPPVAAHAQPAQGNPPAFVPGTNMPLMPFERTVMNGYGSYYQSTPGYYRNPVPYTQSDIGAPVPGWGTSVRVAGPARVGVGADPAEQRMLLTKAQRLVPRWTGDVTGEEPAPTPPDVDEPLDVPAEASEVGGVPWYVWPIAAAVVLGGVGYYGTTKGWF
jgi:hypothetical protein